MIRLFILQIGLLLLDGFVITGATVSFSIPGDSCSTDDECIGDSVCVDGTCLCVDGMKDLRGQCLDAEDFVIASYKSGRKVFGPLIPGKTMTTTKATTTREPSVIGLAGQPCGMGGVCRAMTTCQNGLCICFQGFRASFGECVRNHKEDRVPVPKFKYSQLFDGK